MISVVFPPQQLGVGLSAATWFNAVVWLLFLLVWLLFL